jgi:hypothetical protein
MLLYLLKHSQPEIANAVRELSKVADGATKDHWNQLLHQVYVRHKVSSIEDETRMGSTHQNGKW